MLFVVTSHLYELLDRNGSNGLMTYIVNVQLPLFMFLSGIVITTPPPIGIRRSTRLKGLYYLFLL